MKRVKPMVRAPSLGLTCHGLRQLTELNDPCCSQCHFPEPRQRTGHHLRFVDTSYLSKEKLWPNPGAAYVCCTYKVKIRQLTKKSMTPKPPPDYYVVDDIQGLGCKSPTCNNCGPNIKLFWSYVKQRWMDPKWASDVTHGPIYEGHVCAADAWLDNQNNHHIPEHKAFLCKTMGEPTFGAKYCANPRFAAVLPGKTICLHIPEGDDVGSYVPGKFLGNVSQVCIIPPPPF